MATGWAGDGAVQDQIDATVKDAIKRASELEKMPLPRPLITVPTTMTNFV